MSKSATADLDAHRPGMTSRVRSRMAPCAHLLSVDDGPEQTGPGGIVHSEKSTTDHTDEGVRWHVFARNAING